MPDGGSVRMLPVDQNVTLVPVDRKRCVCRTQVPEVIGPVLNSVASCPFVWPFFARRITNVADLQSGIVGMQPSEKGRRGHLSALNRS